MNLQINSYGFNITGSHGTKFCVMNEDFPSDGEKFLWPDLKLHRYTCEAERACDKPSDGLYPGYYETKEEAEKVIKAYKEKDVVKQHCVVGSAEADKVDAPMFQIKMQNTCGFYIKDEAAVNDEKRFIWPNLELHRFTCEGEGPIPPLDVKEYPGYYKTKEEAEKVLKAYEKKLEKKLERQEEKVHLRTTAKPKIKKADVDKNTWYIPHGSDQDNHSLYYLWNDLEWHVGTGGIIGQHGGTGTLGENPDYPGYYVSKEAAIETLNQYAKKHGIAVITAQQKPNKAPKLNHETYRGFDIYQLKDREKDYYGAILKSNAKYFWKDLTTEHDLTSDCKTQLGRFKSTEEAKSFIDAYHDVKQMAGRPFISSPALVQHQPQPVPGGDLIKEMTAALFGIVMGISIVISAFVIFSPKQSSNKQPTIEKRMETLNQKVKELDK